MLMMLIRTMMIMLVMMAQMMRMTRMMGWEEGGKGQEMRRRGGETRGAAVSKQGPSTTEKLGKNENSTQRAGRSISGYLRSFQTEADIHHWLSKADINQKVNKLKRLAFAAQWYHNFWRRCHPRCGL